MDERSLLLLRMLGYLLNAAIFTLTLIKFRHHAKVLGAWVFWFIVVIFAVLYRFGGDLGGYLFVVDYAVMILLYVNAIIGAWVLLKHQ